MKDQWLTDWPTSERWPVYTRANAGEVLAAPVTPLGWTLVWEQAAGPAWRDAYVEMGVMREGELDAERPEVMGNWGGFFFINLSNVRTWGSRLPGSSVEAADKGMVGDHPDKPPYLPNPADSDPEVLALAAERFSAAMGWETMPRIADEKTVADDARRTRPDLQELTAGQLVERAWSLLPAVYGPFLSNAIAGVYASAAQPMLGAVGAMLGRADEALTLMAGLGDVDSALPTYRAWDLSRIVAADDALRAEFERGVDGLLGRLESLGAPAEPFLAQFAEFLAEFGSRGPSEWDLGAMVWEVQPELLLRHIDRLRCTSDAEAPMRKTERVRAEREKLSAEIAALVENDPEKAGLFSTGLRVARVFVPGRERSKTSAIKALHEIRMAIRELGRRAHRRDHLVDPEHVFMLLAHELDSFVADSAPWRDELAGRAEEFAEFADLEPPFFIDGVVPPLSSWPRRGAASNAAVAPGSVLTGMGGAAGVARGRARVVLNPEDEDRMEPGDVLVAASTDPSWTPLFAVASAVVVNTGAVNSHAVIVSRELGIPCVCSLDDATLRIPDGAYITVDGAAGTVTLDQ